MSSLPRFPLPSVLRVLSSMALAGALHAPALAAVAAEEPHAAPRSSMQAAAAEMTDAEVRKVDKEGGRITLKHGEIKHLDMPPMTMVFTVRDKALLDKVQVGDKVKFKAANEAGRYVVTELQLRR